MEKNKERSLAYVLSQTIEIEHLSAISGGGQNIGQSWCKHETCQGSGSSMRSADVLVDIVVDF